MNHPMKVTLLMDQAWLPAHDPQLLADERSPMTERHVAISLRNLGHEVTVLPVDRDLPGLVRALTENPPDVVFNLVEQFAGERRLSANVVGVLEAMGVPFTGAGSKAIMLCQDKALCKELLAHHRIRSPRFVAMAPGHTPRVPKRARLRYPLIVKPVMEEGSEGIVKDSLVRSDEELADRVRLIHQTWNQVAIAEEYIDGRELYVAVMGNERLKAFPPRELVFGGGSPDAPRIATGRVKADEKYRQKWNITYGFAELEAKLAARIDALARNVCRVLQLRGYARLDLRVTDAGQINVLEVNANPDIAWGDEFAESALKGGLAYEPLIDRLLSLALSR
ncbi:MAG: D-alanine--D-alanine ligase [Phycisphaerae bacterium]|nr:D-alanine--D-alanine ligase [Phycisphaerae bacterium]